MKDVVVTIGCVVLLGAVLGAGGLTGRQHAKSVVCMTNVRALGQAWLLYAEDNDGLLVGGSTYNSTEYRWCERPLRPGTTIPIPFGVNPGNFEAGGALANHEARLRGIRAGYLFAYTGNENLYHCPADTNYTRYDEPYAVFRTYAIAGQMNAEDFRSNSNQSVALPGGGTRKFRMARRTTEIVSPAEKYVFLGEDVVGTPVHGMQWYNLGSFVLMGGTYYWTWWDIPANYHGDRSTLGFADGHVEMHQWKDPRTLALINHARGAPGQPSNTQPNNEDIVYLNEGYFPCQ
jgi:prepilin-type processing-associated H-X9-DG protein